MSDTTVEIIERMIERGNTINTIARIRGMGRKTILKLIDDRPDLIVKSKENAKENSKEIKSMYSFRRST